MYFLEVIWGDFLNHQKHGNWERQVFNVLMSIAVCPIMVLQGKSPLIGPKRDHFFSKEGPKRNQTLSKKGPFRPQ